MWYMDMLLRLYINWQYGLVKEPKRRHINSEAKDGDGIRWIYGLNNLPDGSFAF